MDGVNVKQEYTILLLEKKLLNIKKGVVVYAYNGKEFK